MGLLRLVLALSVVSGHGAFFRPFFFVNASAAVACFFVVSGFYMALVLNEKYTNRVEFFKARLLKLYPAYFFFTALYLTIWGGSFTLGSALATLSLIGQDYYGIAIAPDDPLKYIPIAQAWSVSVELQLYLVAALLFQVRGGIVAVFATGLVLRVLLVSLGYSEAPLGVWFLPNVLVYFGAGGMAYLAYDKMRRWPVSRLRLGTALSVAWLLVYCYAFSGFWSLDAQGSDWRLYPLYAGIAIACPFLFALTKDSGADRMLGELSYPIYLCHILVLTLVQHRGPWVVALSIFALAALWYFIDLRLRGNGRVVLVGRRIPAEKGLDTVSARVHGH